MPSPASLCALGIRCTKRGAFEFENLAVGELDEDSPERSNGR
jgi:hypothetical protein